MDNPRIDFDRISQQAVSSIRNGVISNEIDKCNGEVLISDCLSHKDQSGLIVMQILDKENTQLRFRIKILKDKWGEPVEPGTKYEWFVEREVRDRFGKKHTQNDIRRLTQVNRIRSIEVWNSAIVDEYGCIEVGFRDAALLLDTRGVHFESGFPLTRYKETSSAPSKRPDGSVKLQHYWLYQEVPSWEYNEMVDAGEAAKLEVESNKSEQTGYYDNNSDNKNKNKHNKKKNKY